MRPSLRVVPPSLRSVHPALRSVHPALRSVHPALRSVHPALRVVPPTLRSIAGAPCVAALLLLAGIVAAGLPADAQDDAFSQRNALERRLRAHPDDTGLLCELGWARFRTHADQEAHVIAADAGPDQAPILLDRAITLLGQPTTEPLQRRLAACLYSRGRVAEATGIAGAIPFYERSLALRPNATVAARLAGARRAAAAGWVSVPVAPSADTPRELAALAGEDARLVAWWRSAAGDEVVVLAESTVVVAARRAGGAWRTRIADRDFEGDVDRVWIEAPGEGEIIRVVVTVGRESRYTMDDGPEYGATVHAVTTGVGEDGTLREVARDPWS